MKKEKEVITQIVEFVDSTGKKDYIQEVTEYFTVQRNGEQISSEEVVYRRVSDRTELMRLSDCEFKVISTGETIIIIDRALSQNP